MTLRIISGIFAMESLPNLLFSAFFSSVDRALYYRRTVLHITVTPAAFNSHLHSNIGVVTGIRSSENQSEN